MSKILLYRLQMNREAILRDLEAETVLDYLYQENVLDCDEYEDVRDKKPRRKQAALLLDYVEQSSQPAPAIQKMIDGLENSCQRHLAFMLKEELPDEARLSQGIRSSFRKKQDLRYPMLHVPCGYALIFNNSDFDVGTQLEHRCGSDLDTRKMADLFTWLQFKVIVNCNKTADEITSVILHYQVDVDHDNADCFVLFFMSHGFHCNKNGDGIYGKDGSKVYLNRIRQHFTADNCYSLAKKPKLIFVQACRGGVADKGQEVTESPSGFRNTSIIPALDDHSIDSQPYRPDDRLNSIDENNSHQPGIESEYIPQDADILTAYASSANYAAIRNTSTGGWFVSELDYVFRKDARCEDLQSMLITVTGNVSSRRGSRRGIDDGMMECPQQTGNLRKKLFFNPKNT